MDDYLVYYNNTTNPLEELINSEQLIIQIHKHEKYSKHDICMDIYTCPNLQTRFPIMKIYSYFDMYTFDKIEDKDYIFSEYINSNGPKVRTTSYLSLTEPRYITPVDINNRILQKNYKFNKEEMVNISMVIHMQSWYTISTNFSLMTFRQSIKMLRCMLIYTIYLQADLKSPYTSTITMVVKYPIMGHL